MLPQTETFSEENAKEPMASKTYKMEGNRIVGFVDDLDAMKQAVWKRLHTEQGMYDIYQDDYGIKTVDLIGKEFGYAASVIQGRIKESLMQDDRVVNVTGFEVVKEGNSMEIGFVVHTIFGSFTSETETKI